MLRRAGIDHDVVLYLKNPPDRATLADLVDKLEDPPADLVRRDKFFNDRLLADGFDPATLDDPAVVVEVLVEHPRLLQRPVVVAAGTAVIGRPRERVPALLGID